MSVKMGIQMENTRQYASSSGKTAKLVKNPQVTINVTAADKAHLKIRSQLLRLAKKVVDNDSADKSKLKSSEKVGN